MIKKAMKNYNFLKIFKGILRFFERFVKFFLEIFAKIQGNFRTLWKSEFIWGSAGEAPEANENILKRLVENQWKHQELWRFS